MDKMSGTTDLPVSPPAAAPPRVLLGRRFDRLRVKLFLAIAGANALVAIIAYLAFSWSFDRGFVEYMHRGDVARLEPLVTALATDYARDGGWQRVVSDREAWMARTRAALGLQPRNTPTPPTAPNGRPDARDFPLTIDPRLMLFDADRSVLIGRPERVDDAEALPIVVNDATVGYLGYIRRHWLFESVERLTSAQQHSSFAAIALGMLGAALLLGAGLAHWLTRRIRALGAGTAALTRGEYNVQLEARGHDELAQLARDFNQLAATLAATRRARSQWVADIAHELRTPLAVLRGEIEAMQDGVRPLDAGNLASLAQEAARLGRLVEDLHLLSMSDLGALNYYTEPVDMAEVIEDVLAAHRGALADRPLEVDADLQSVMVVADAARLAQVYGNLLQNSLRYTDPGGRLAIRIRAEAERIHVRWEDSAPGVPAEELDRLTDRLYRVDASRNRAAGGSGLGLAIAKAIVEAHHGRMRAEASPLGGLCWHLEFPRHG